MRDDSVQPHIATLEYDGRRFNVTCRISFDGIEYVGHLWFADEAWDDNGVPDRGSLPGRTRDEALTLARRLTPQELMLRYRHVAQCGLMISDTARGRVRGRPGAPLIRYDLAQADVATVHRGLVRLAELLQAAGARTLHLPLARLPTLPGADPAPLREVQQSISAGLLWVFVAMVLLSAALLAVTTLLPARKADHAEPALEPVPA